jgi:hypothetical protein
MEKVILSRTEAMQKLGVSKTQMIRIEKSNNLTKIKLIKTPNGGVYYKIEEIEALLTPQVA